jgi:hypothetical protein
MRNKAVIMGLAVALMAGIGLADDARASSHREAPGIATRPNADNTDVYFFVSPTNPDAVTMVGCFWPMEEPAGAPNFFHFGENIDYVFHVDNDGDNLDDVAFIFRFQRQFTNPNTALYATGEISSLNDPDWNYRQTYKVIRVDNGQYPGQVLADGLIVPPVNIGPRTTPNYEDLAEQAVYALNDGTKVFAGQRDDPFFVDLGAIFDLLAFRQIPGNTGQGVDGVGGYNCQAIELEVPIALLTRDGSNPESPADPAAVLGVWSSTYLRQNDSPSINSLTQVSRLGMPLVNEVVIPIARKDVWNASRPQDDGQFLSYVTDPELARLIQAVYGIPAPPTPRCDLVAIFLTGVPGLNQPPNVVPGEQLRLNVAIKPDGMPDSRFGLLGGDVDGFPNGRRLADDVVDIAERVVEGVAYPLLCDANYEPHPLAGQLGDGIDQNDMPFLDHFPYLATPHEGWQHEHHRVEPPHDPQRTQGKLSLSPNGQATQVGGPSETEGLAVRFQLGASWPNPAKGPTQIGFQLDRESPVTLKVVDISGRVVRTVASGSMPAGPHSAEWDGTDENGNAVPAGIYLYRLEAPGQRADRKITVLH